jgi:hypothetical protein
MVALVGDENMETIFDFSGKGNPVVRNPKNSV